VVASPKRHDEREIPLPACAGWLRFGHCGCSLVRCALQPEGQSRLLVPRPRQAWLYPPDAVFPVVRTSLYPLIARSEWRIWSAAPSRERYAALRRWISQLVANPQWSKLCFGERRPTLALADVLALAGMIGPYAAGARKVDGAAAYAFIPYGASGCIRHSSAPRNRAAQSSGRLMRDLTRTEVVSSLLVWQRLGECFSQRLPASPW
jgi:benzodiazapine receptor